MAYTTTDQLEITPSGDIRNGGGNYDPDSTIYYGEDIKLVKDQEGVIRLEFINVIFRRDDGFTNVPEVTVLAAIAHDNISEVEKILKIVALPWQPYFHQTRPEYAPGSKLFKIP